MRASAAAREEPLVEARPVDVEAAAVAVDVPRVLLLEVVSGRERERAV